MSDSQWYYEKHGKAEGPISTHEMARKVQEGELHFLDLVFKEGEGQWHPIENFPEITELVKTTATQFTPHADWIVLRTIQVDGLDKREQIGPFTLEQVLQLIDKGRIKFSDHVWRTGYENWVPLGQVEDFDAPLLSSVQVDQSLYEKPKRKDLEAKEQSPIKFYKPAQKLRPKDEEPPVEAQGEDLAKPDWQKVSVAPKKESKQKNEPIVDLREIKPQPSEEPTEKKNTPKVAEVQQRWRGVASFVVILLFLFGAALFAVNGRKAYEFYKTQQERILFEPVKEEIKIVADPKPPRPALKVENTPPVIAEPIKVQKEEAAVRPSEPLKIKSEVVAESPQKMVPAEAPAKPEVKKIETKKPAVAKQETEEELIEKGTSKQKSYFVNNERLFLFYNAQKGLRFVTEIEKILKKPPTKKAALKSTVSVWLKQVKAFSKQAESANQEKRIHQELYKKLNRITKNLLERGEEIESQLANGRGLAKNTTFVEIIADYKKLAKSAQAID